MEGHIHHQFQGGCTGQARAKVAEGGPSSGCGDLAAGWNIIVPFLGLDFHAAGPHGRTMEADYAPIVNCPHPGAGSGSLGVHGK